MGNLIISIKRFFQNKNTVTLFALLLSVGIIYIAYNYRIKQSIEPVNVPYATKEIGPRTPITKEMVSVKKVPGGVVTDKVIKNTGSIIGKYVINTGVIPEGSLFYSSMVINWEDFPKSVFADIANGETVYALKVNSASTFGNSIFPGNYIDIYYQTTVKEGNQRKVWIGKFIESIRVLDVQDRYGHSVFETNGTPKQPAQLLFNIKDDVFLLFKKIEMINGVELFPVQRNANYSKQASPAKIVGNEFKKFIEEQAVDDDIVLK